MGQYLRSHQKSTCATASSNRVFARQVRAHQWDRLARDPAIPPPPPPPIANTPKPPNRKGHMRQTWQNAKLATNKALHFPDRPIPREDNNDLFARASVEWDSLSVEERCQWSRVHAAVVAQQRVIVPLGQGPVPREGADAMPLAPIWGKRPFCVGGGCHGSIRPSPPRSSPRCTINLTEVHDARMPTRIHA